MRGTLAPRHHAGTNFLLTETLAATGLEADFAPRHYRNSAAAEGAGGGSDGPAGGRTAVKDNENRGNHNPGERPVADNTETAPVPLEGIPSAIAVHLT